MTEEAREKKNEYMRSYYQNHKEQMAKNRKRWRDKSREHINEYQREYRRRNKDKVKEYNARYWQKKAGASNDIYGKETADMKNLLKSTLTKVFDFLVKTGICE